ncbi:MAG TPA: hypothetical protein VF125_00335 [Solirubrobacterales bacterium]
MKPGSIVIAAALAQRPRAGGHTWFALQYLLGFRALGWEVTLIDRLDAELSLDGIDYLAETMERFGLAGDWAVLLPEGGSAGLSRTQVESRLASSDLLLNVMGYLDDEELLAAPPMRVFLDVDPGFGQMWRRLGLADLFAGHDRFVSVGLNVGSAGCAVPDCGLDWTPTLPPVALDHWPVASGGTRFTSVATWRGPYGPVEYEGRTYGLRVHEFRRFLPLPELTRAEFEIALAIDPADAADVERLKQAGWSLLDPGAVASGPEAYRRFIQGSAAELTVAKGMYVDTESGWFSDRSACYLASGKPVIAQETGFGGHLPTGEGLLAFSDLEEAVAAVEDVRHAPGRHARAARGIAEEHFGAERVLSRMIDELGAVRTYG